MPAPCCGPTRCIACPVADDRASTWPGRDRLHRHSGSQHCQESGLPITVPNVPAEDRLRNRQRLTNGLNGKLFMNRIGRRRHAGSSRTRRDPAEVSPVYIRPLPVNQEEGSACQPVQCVRNRSKRVLRSVLTAGPPSLVHRLHSKRPTISDRTRVSGCCCQWADRCGPSSPAISAFSA